MASKIKVDNITDQDDNAVISRCGSTHTVTAEVYKADTIQDTNGNAYFNKCGTAITIGGGSDTTTFPGAAVATGNITGANLISSGNVVKSNAYQASDGGVIISQSGTTITLGASGDTIQLAAGATNGLGGGISWETTPKTANFNAGAGEGYFVDTSSNTVTVTLPTGVIGESVTVLDYVSNANTNAIIFAPQSGEKIEGGTAGQGVTANRQATTLTYSSAAQGWLVSSSGDSGPIAAPTITFTTASGSLGRIAGPSERADPNGNLSPVTGTASFGTVSYSIQSGSLPGGLTLNSSTGAFSGTATQVVGADVTSNFTVRITITETGTTSDRAFAITVGSDALYISASGGTQTTSGDYKIHTFTGPGTFTVSSTGNACGSNAVDYLVVAGGGGGGGSQGGGGGGAGGYRESCGVGYTSSPRGSGVSQVPVTAQGYPVSIGAGGPGQPGTGTSGGSSSAVGITSAGGGGGGKGGGPPTSVAGAAGGSGGGGGGRSGRGGGAGNSPSVSPAQGFAGGASKPSPSPSRDNGGGGGGATVVGTAGAPGNAGAGGAGGTTGITGSNTSYGGGGGGGSELFNNGVGGTGGGGNGGSAGSANTGGGGGGNDGEDSGSGFNAGSGIVIIRYKFQN
jgi:hypothetical protein